MRKENTQGRRAGGTNAPRAESRRSARRGGALLALLFLLLAAGAARADVIISEVMASNGWYENGHAWDWV